MISFPRRAAPKLRYVLSVLALAAGSAAVGILAATAPAGADTYTVQSGDTLSGIADRLGIEYAALLGANGALGSPDDIQPGQEIQLPAEQGGAAASGSATYTVRSGDTLSGIAAEHGTTVERLEELNPSLNPNQLAIGQVVTVRGAVARPAAERTGEAETTEGAPVQVFRYTVQPGDTGTGIAAEFDTSVSAIRAQNPGLNLDVIAVGETILVPRPAAGVAVRPGETMFGIGLRFGIDLDSMVELNSHLDADNLQPGDVVYIPYAAAAPASVAPTRTTTVAAAPAAPRTHVVESGETLSGIAGRYELTLLQLRGLNPELDGDLIDVGQRLVVSRPATAAPAPVAVAAPAVARTYVVAAGDVLGSIAARHNLTLLELRRLNPQLAGDFIDVGDQLVVSAGAAVAARVPTHRVASGDTLYGIAREHGLTVDQIRALNPALQGDALTIGTEVRLALGAGSEGELVTEAVTGGAALRTVTESDQVQYVAAELGTLPQTLLDNNPWLGADAWVSVGTELVVPATPGKLITVEPGDTLSRLAERHGVQVEDITHVNGARLGSDVIVPGQQLLVPIPIPAFHWPVSGGEISDGFGLCRTWDCSWRHRGLDMAHDMGAQVLAPANGIVTFAGGNAGTGLGYYVQIQHQYGFSTVLAHLSQWNVRLGEQVERGQLIGLVGSTGNSTGPHLHFEVKHYDWYVDPAILLPPR